MGSNSTLNLNGRVEKTDIPTLLRSVEKDKLTGELSFSRPDERVDLYFLFGQLYHAKWRDVIGTKVVTELLNWRNGNYAFTEGVIPAQASINEDIERILSEIAPQQNIMQSSRPSSAITPRAAAPAPPPSRPSETLQVAEPVNPSHYIPEVAAFDLSSLAAQPTNPRPALNEPRARSTKPFQSEDTNRPRTPATTMESPVATDPAVLNDRIAPSPPAEGHYRTRYFCLPAGEQMATSLVATGPQLEEEMLHLAEISFTGYILGSPEVENYPAVGICLLGGRFIHAFVHGPNGQMLEGEKAYRMTLDQRGAASTRFYWFYEISAEAMRSAIALLTPPSRYVHLEARIIRFREMMQILTEERHTGCLRITSGPNGTSQPNIASLTSAGAYLPIYQGKVMGLWTDSNPRLSNDGPLLQRILAEPNAFIDLHTTTTVAEPGLSLESLITARNSGLVETTLAVPAQAESPSPPPTIDDDERQLQLISSISRMESTWTQMQLKDKLDEHTKLLALAGFVNEVLSLSENVSGRRSLGEMLGRAMRQELAPFRTIFQLLDLPIQGRVNIIKLLKEYELFTRDSEQSGTEFYREACRALRTLIRSTFQYYVSLIRQEHTRFECQEIYEVFLQEIVKKM